MSAINRFATRARAALLIGAAGLLGGCATTLDGAARLEKVMREDPAARSGYVEVASGEAARFVTVFRGRPVAARTPFALQRGDEIETGPGSAAVIRFADGGSALLGASTRVRVGSLEVLFGNVLARVRGLFSVESENVIAGVEGTEFLFTVGADRGVRVVVLDGVVVCRPKRGTWGAIRLGATQAFSYPYPNRVPPRVEQADLRELDGIRAWAQRVVGAQSPPLTPPPQPPRPPPYTQPPPPPVTPPEPPRQPPSTQPPPQPPQTQPPPPGTPPARPRPLPLPEPQIK